MSTVLKVNQARLWQSLMDLAKIGATKLGGNCRLALTDEDKDGRDLVCGWLKSEGLIVRVDQLGNMFARRDGTDNSLPPVMFGSHIDTQPTGGKFDGCFGSLAALEVIRCLNENHIRTKAPLDVAIWTNEEGSRFVPVMMGSGVFSGVLTQEEALNATDKTGKRVADELQRIGYAGKEAVGGYPVTAYFETHIEQGPELDTEKLPVGIVIGALGLYWYDIIVTGQESHAGPTPMSYRRDAMKMSAALISDILHLTDNEQPDGRVTVGEMDVFPNSRNVVPGKIRFTVDLRHSDDNKLQELETALYQIIEQHQQAGVSIDVKVINRMKPTHFNQQCIEHVRESVKALGYPEREIISGAGHDAVYISRKIPTAMIFVPCIGGLSHNELEDARPEELAAGASVLLNTIIAQANQ